MGTNFFRIPNQSERGSIAEKLQNDFVVTLEKFKSENFSSKYLLQLSSMTNEFSKDLLVHIGKKSAGWNFTFNYNEGNFYKDSKELTEFIRSGVIVNEYDEIIPTEEFLSMALSQNTSFKRQRNYDDNCFVIDGYDFLDIYFR